MRRSALFLGFATAVSARCSAGPCLDKCAKAVQTAPDVGAAFCSSYLSVEPVTVTVTEVVPGPESTHTDWEAITSTLTVTASTTTTTLAATTVFQKRLAGTTSSSGPAETISSSCASDPAQISSACSCFFGSSTSISTATVTETSSSAIIYEQTATSTDVSTTSVVATVSVAGPISTIPANPLLNGGFESSSSSIAPWADTVAVTGGTLEIITPVDSCMSSGACSGGKVIIRVHPPTSGSGYTAIYQSFVARPSTTYTLTYLYRCLNFSANTGIDVYYQGEAIGYRSLCSSSVSFSQGSGFVFTTDSSGVGTLEVRFLNPDNLPYLYFYADQFITAAIASS